MNDYSIPERLVNKSIKTQGPVKFTRPNAGDRCTILFAGGLVYVNGNTVPITRDEFSYHWYWDRG